ncbi:MAG: M23 family metallopeptidase [Candidatus Eremiobacteraeota bacterium]|nr:M23 family metallopeptidase [Candidatus Eremiobacteraeota bacterium]
MKQRYFVKIVPPRADRIHRLEFTRNHIVAAVCVLIAIILGALGLHAFQLYDAKVRLNALQTLTAAQSERLQTIDRQTGNLRSQLQMVEKQNQQLGQLMGIREPRSSGHRKSHETKLSRLDHSHFSREASRIEDKLRDLAAASQATSTQAAFVRRMTLRILNLRHIEAVERSRMLAAIPSIDPVAGAPIVGCFCYRTDPSTQFHPGLDLGADYGETVRAAAAGTVATADWDGGFGLKVDIDHGNGYHSWYAHLSKTLVQAGQHVVKGEPIGLVGSTGFSTGPHLHYQLMLNGSPIDPTAYLSGVPRNVLATLP